MKALFKSKNFWMMIFADIVMVGLAYYFAHFLRFEGSIPAEHYRVFRQTAPVAILLKMTFFFVFNLYRGMWRYTSLVDFINILKATAAASLSLLIIVLLVYDYRGISRSVFVLDYLLTLFFIAGTRLGIRVVFSTKSPEYSMLFKRKDRNAKRILLIGAGNTGERVIREIMGNPKVDLIPIGFLDDDASKQAQSIHGVEVLGSIDQIEDFTDDFDEILITAPSATSAVMKRIVAACERTGKPFKTMPPLEELIDGRISLKMVREVTITDVVGRAEVRLDDQEIKQYLLGKRVLITGAGGSIGSELVRQIGRFKPQAVALLDFSEYNLFQVENECQGRFNDVTTKAYLVDLRNILATKRVFDEFRPQVVFHAAAYKHVPMQENNPWEAVQNNLLGTKNVLECCVLSHVAKFILVSSDKAVRPTNVMGTTKRICELLSTSGNGNSATKFIAVRFGNVLGSSGSVIPLFRRQIAEGGPVTVTHPDITRYFMSIPEAAQLILQAGAMGEGGEIFILKMGEPMRIVDLAREVIRLCGYEPEKDIEIVYTGLRPGEKLFEELITEGEGIVPTGHEKIMVLRGQCCHQGYINGQVDELIEIAESFDAAAIKRKLHEIVPEYTPQK